MITGISRRVRHESVVADSVPIARPRICGSAAWSDAGLVVNATLTPLGMETDETGAVERREPAERRADGLPNARLAARLIGLLVHDKEQIASAPACAVRRERRRHHGVVGAAPDEVERHKIAIDVVHAQPDVLRPQIEEGRAVLERPELNRDEDRARRTRLIPGDEPGPADNPATTATVRTLRSKASLGMCLAAS